jgi:hypothetical protein
MDNLLVAFVILAFRSEIESWFLFSKEDTENLQVISDPYSLDNVISVCDQLCRRNVFTRDVKHIDRVC